LSFQLQLLIAGCTIYQLPLDLSNGHRANNTAGLLAQFLYLGLKAPFVFAVFKTVG
jgi:hypothetical protein